MRTVLYCPSSSTCLTVPSTPLASIVIAASPLPTASMWSMLPSAPPVLRASPLCTMSFHHDQIWVAIGVSKRRGGRARVAAVAVVDERSARLRVQELEDVRLDPERDAVLGRAAGDDLLRVLLDLRERLRRLVRVEAGLDERRLVVPEHRVRQAPRHAVEHVLVREVRGRPRQQLGQRVVIGVDARLDRHDALAVDHALDRRVLGLEEVGQRPWSTGRTRYLVSRSW